MTPSAYTVGNFKAISTPQTLHLRPITLIFGQNSAGKSSIIQSLLLCQHALQKGTFDFSSVTRWGQRIDLGGFRQYIHKHETDRKLSFGFTFTRDKEEKSFSPQDAKYTRDLSDDAYWSFSYLNDLKELSVQLEVGLQSDKSGKESPQILEIVFSGNGEELLHFTRNSKSELVLAQFSSENKAITSAIANLLQSHIDELEDDDTDSAMDELLEEVTGSLATDDSHVQKFRELAVEVYNELMSDVFGDDSPSKEGEKLQRVLDQLNDSDRLAQAASAITSALQEELKEPMRRLTIKGEGLKLSVDPRRRGPSTRHDVRESYADGQIADTGTSMGDTVEVEAIEDPLLFFQGMPDSQEKGPVQAFAKALRFDLETLLDACFDGLEHWLGDTEYIGPYRSIPERFFQISKEQDSEEVDQGYQTLRRIGEDPSLVRKITEIFQDTLKSPYRLETRTIAPSLNIQELEEELTRARELSKGNENNDYIRDTMARLSEGKKQVGVYLVDTRNGAAVDFCDVGFGISQVLPLIAELVKYNSSLVCIEQPEVHLHPKMQSDLADVVIEACNRPSSSYNSIYIMETHSEHIILRLLKRIRETSRNSIKTDDGLQPDDVSVVWVEGGKNGSKLTHLEIDPRGRFKDDWPNGFFEERLDELF